jgi:hypothetical protein
VLQAVVKEGTGCAGRLVVKLTNVKASTGNPNFARRLLGLPDLQPSGAKAAALAVMGGLVERQQDQAGGGSNEAKAKGAGGDEGDEEGRKSMRGQGGVRFGAGDDDEQQQQEGEDEDVTLRSKSGKVGEGCSCSSSGL